MTSKKQTGLIYNEEDTKKISEVFGMSSDKYTSICSDYLKWILFDVDDERVITKTLKNYLESDIFKKHKWTPITPNDFFMLGYIFNSVINTYKRKAFDIQKNEESDSEGIDGLLKKLRKLKQDLEA